MTREYVNVLDGEIKSFEKGEEPGYYDEDWYWVTGVGTGDVGFDGTVLAVVNTIEGVIDWWIGLGHFATDINRVSKTKIIISGAGKFINSSFLGRLMYAKDIDGDLVVSYTQQCGQRDVSEVRRNLRA